MKLLFLIPLLLIGCSVAPTIKTADGTLITLGGSIMEDSAHEQAQVSGNGWVMSYVKQGKNQSKAPISLARTAATYGIASLAADTDAAREVTQRRRMRERTRRHSTDASVETTRITSDAAIERARLEQIPKP